MHEIHSNNFKKLHFEHIMALKPGTKILFLPNFMHEFYSDHFKKNILLNYFCLKVYKYN